MGKELNYTLITGGSRGIGNALAWECASRGMNLLLVSKQAEGLNSAVQSLRDEFKVDIKSFLVDLRDLDAPQKVVNWCSENGYRVDILINNAGVAGTADFSKSPLSYSDERIMVNIRSLVLLTRLFLPELQSHSKAHILNMGSLSAYYPLPFKSVYGASKAFVVSFSRAINEELRGGTVQITVINPNGVRTNPDTFKRINTHSRILKFLFIMDAGDIARIAIDKMLKGKLVVVPGFMNRFLILISRFIPSRIKEKLIAHIFGKEVLY